MRKGLLNYARNGVALAVIGAVVLVIAHQMDERRYRKLVLFMNDVRHVERERTNIARIWQPPTAAGAL